MIFIKSMLIAALVVVVSFKLPQVHNSYLRNYVGSKTFKVVDPFFGGGGTGFVVTAPSGKTYIMSNAHVCEPMTQGMVDLVSNTGEVIPSFVIAIDPNHDLCLVAAPAGLKGLKIAAEEPEVGTLIHTIGFPLLGNMSVASGEVLATEFIDQYKIIAINDECEGQIEDLRGTIYQLLFGIEAVCIFDELATLSSNTIYPGNSGSATVNSYGTVVGVAYMIHLENHNLSYNVPVSAIHEFLKDF